MVSYTSLLALTLCVAAVASQGPEVCGDTGRSCIAGRSFCNGEGTCECLPRYVWGDPFKMCYKKNQVAAESCNDVFFTTFKNETADFPYPCRYKLAHIRQQLKNANKDIVGTCEFTVFAFNKRYLGKVVTEGFDLAMRLTYTNGSMATLSTRQYGVASNGVNSITSLGSTAYAPNGDWTAGVPFQYSDAPNGINIFRHEEEENNNLVVEAAACGLRITFVPYDEVLRRSQANVPGLTVGINCAHKPEFLSQDVVMALDPETPLSSIQQTDLSISQSLIDRAFRSGVPQNHPAAQPSCTSTGGNLDDCSEVTRAQAYANCYWMLEEPSFIKCAHGNGLDFVELFRQCVWSWCGTFDCDDVVDDVRKCDHITTTQALTDFIAGKHCPAS